MLHFFARRMKEAREDERGFTLIELLVVVIIIGILAAIAIPTFLNQRQKAQDADAVSAARNAATVVQSIATDCSGKFFGNAPTCTAKITAAQVMTAEPAINATNAPSTLTLAVATGGATFTAKYTSESGRVATYDSTTGKVTVA